MASSSALVVPAVFYFVGVRLWVLGKRHGFLTQVEVFRERWGSERLGVALFVALVGLTVPYLLIGVLGSGVTLAEVTGGQVPRWAGSLATVVVVFVYVAAGGVRATAWANTFQTFVFMALGVGVFALIVGDLGGLGAALARVSPALLHHGAGIPAGELVSYTLIPLSVGTFPHLFMHWLTARRASTFRLAIVAYPLCLLPIWVPSVLLGVIGTADVPGLAGPAANGVLVRLIERHSPEALAGLLAAGVVAAVTASLDSQVLALATLFTRDVLRRARRGRPLTPRGELVAGRAFVAALLGAAFLLSLVVDRGIFPLGVWSFTGFTALFPLVVAALYWRRATRAGAWASLLTAAGLWTWFVLRAGGGPETPLGPSGLMPVVVVTAAATAALVVVSLLTRPPEPAALARFFPAEARRAA
jgi:SSS family solute:Na+ symporter